MLGVVYAECYQQTDFTECHYAKCRYAECRGACLDCACLVVLSQCSTDCHLILSASFASEKNFKTKLGKRNFERKKKKSFLNSSTKPADW
jgi:hypothetical protein